MTSLSTEPHAADRAAAALRWFALERTIGQRPLDSWLLLQDRQRPQLTDVFEGLIDVSVLTGDELGCFADTANLLAWDVSDRFGAGQERRRDGTSTR